MKNLSRLSALAFALAGCSSHYPIPGIDNHDSPDHHVHGQATNAALPMPPTNVVKSLTHPATAPRQITNAILPAFRYPRGAETNAWVLQGKSNERQGWVDISYPFAGTNSGSYAVSNVGAPAQFRMRKL